MSSCLWTNDKSHAKSEYLSIPWKKYYIMVSSMDAQTEFQFRQFTVITSHGLNILTHVITYNIIV